MISFMNSFQTVQLIQQATRVTVDCLALFPLKSVTIISKSTPQTIQFRSYKTFNDDLFLQDLSLLPLHSLDNLENPDDFWNRLMSLTLPLINKHTPIKERRIKRNSVPCMPDDILEMIHLKESPRKRLHRNRDPNLWT